MIGRFLGALALILLVSTPAACAATPPDDPASEGPRPAVKVPFPPIKDFSTLKIDLRRTPCYGWCPAYRLQIAGDGTVTWFGEHFVEAKGSRTSKIPVETVKALFDAFVKADFFWTHDEYRAPITDLPTQILTISFDGHTKSVEDYAGGHVGMPKAIDDLEDAVDAAAGSKVWIGNSRER